MGHHSRFLANPSLKERVEAPKKKTKEMKGKALMTDVEKLEKESKLDKKLEKKLRMLKLERNMRRANRVLLEVCLARSCSVQQ